MKNLAERLLEKNELIYYLLPLSDRNVLKNSIYINDLPIGVCLSVWFYAYENKHFNYEDFTRLFG